MSSIQIQNAFDITVARNQLRQKIVGKEWTPGFRARAATVLTAIGELILRSRQPSMLDVTVVMGRGTWGVKVRCSLPNGEHLRSDTVRQKLSPLADEVQVQDKEGQLLTEACVWLSERKAAL
jgi:hypothetical protein